MRILLVLMALVVAAGMARAAPQAYLLDREGSQVVFTWFLGSDAVTGRMPIKSADLLLDFDQAANSRIRVTLDVAHARAGFPFATLAMTGPKVLDADAHPEIIFHSTRVIGQGTRADVQGDLTIRGVTRPAVFVAQLFRTQGTDPGDRSRLTVLLTGAVSRTAFGATGWSDMAGDEVRFEVHARVIAVP